MDKNNTIVLDLNEITKDYKNIKNDYIFVKNAIKKAILDAYLESNKNNNDNSSGITNKNYIKINFIYRNSQDKAFDMFINGYADKVLNEWR